MRPFVLVGVENTERRRDMTGPTENVEDKKIAVRVGGAAAFRKFLRSELMPAVNSRYRTTRERAIVGESLAGLFVVETFVLEPDLFDTYIAFDPSVWWNDQKLLGEASRRLRDWSGGEKTIFIALSGDADFMDSLGDLLRPRRPTQDPLVLREDAFGKALHDLSSGSDTGVP